MAQLAQTLREQLGLDVPAHVQYVRWLGELFQGKFGKSLWTRQPVGADILFRLPISLQLGLMAIIFSLVIALPVGIISGIRPDSGIDQVLRSFAILLGHRSRLLAGHDGGGLPGAVVEVGAAIVLRPIR